MKQNHRAISSRTELLAKEMRERALLIEGNPTLTVKELQGIRLQKAKEKQLAKVEAMKKLYFNAGRWAGGARDHIAREAFEQMNELEQ
jgi:bacterioferritin (cytochrome b1)